MKRATQTLLFILLTTSVTFAELPLEELWTVELDSATAIGNAWTDEDGNSNILVGDSRRAHLISNGEIIWSCDSLIGDVTALAWIPYSDGEQIVVAASEPIPGPDDGGWEETRYGYLYRFGGDEFERLSELQLLEYWYNIDLITDARNVTKLAILPGMIQADEHPVLAAWETSSWAFFGGDDLAGYIGVISDDSFEYTFNGYPVEMEVFQDFDDRSKIALGWHRWYDQDDGNYGEYTSDVTLFDADLSAVNSVELAEHTFFAIQGPWSPPDRRPELLGMTTVQSDDQTSLYAAYSDTSHAFLCELSIPDLEVIQTRSLPNDWQRGQMLSFQWEGDDTDLTNLLLIDSGGNVLVFDAETLTQIENGALPRHYVRSIKTDFGTDGNYELLTLTRNRLICYGISPLATPPDNFIPHPSSFTLSEPYPNPFNSHANITYQVPEAGNVSIYLYDLKGQLVAELLNENQTPGQYSVMFEAKDLCSGVYLIRMTNRKAIVSRKVVLLR